ncbi:ATP-binding protein [Bowmanella yangjiangensis]|uniref:histidine kinase n=1 Tax=Bowmanella yangjiangensis TaxID=2811230 RepID=A0ABS3CYJ0_9ALTE|nr:ATP-binding protein [Bowmanella yangjiangensis]MBN7821609.1 two-component sensor histidine kinase [Bowmanella yangjiangensis]
MSSIRRYLVLILLSVITLVLFFAAIKGYRGSMERATSLFDSQLVAVADTLETMQLTMQVGQLRKESEMILQIWHNNELLLYSFNSPKSPMTAFEQGFRDENFSGQRWRTLARYYPDSQHWLMLAQPLSHRYDLADELVLAAVQPLVFSLPLLALLISLAVKQGLRPLVGLSDALKQKKADDLSPVELNQPPSELQPVLKTINRLLVRLDSAFARERRFASDAAHELRTPLSVLKINCHNLAQELGSKSTNLAQLTDGVERMGHVVDQILLLNRTNPEHFSVNWLEVDLYQLCQQCIANLYPQLHAKQQQIGLSGKATPMRGDAFSLNVLVQNLVSNASKYSPVGSQIEVSVEQRSQGIWLCVEDSGPGLPESEYERVFERFYRVGGDRHQSGTTGCGLGLAIVKHIVDLYGAHIQLQRSVKLGGLSVQVQFSETRGKYD